MSKLRKNVLSVQRSYIRLRRIRTAYVDLLMDTWNELLEEAYKDYFADQAAAANKLAQEKFDVQLQLHGARLSSKGRSSQSTRSSIKQPSLGSLPLLPRLSVIQRECNWNALRNFEKLPNYISRMELYPYVVQMLRSQEKRLKAWEAEMKLAKENTELQNFTRSGDDTFEKAAKRLWKSRPGKVFIDREELDKMVRTTLKRWHSGGYRHVRLRHTRLFQLIFKAFRALVADKPSRVPSPLGDKRRPSLVGQMLVMKPKEPTKAQTREELVSIDDIDLSDEDDPKCNFSSDEEADTFVTAA